MTDWSIDLRPRAEPRSFGVRKACLSVIALLAGYGLAVGLGSLFVR